MFPKSAFLKAPSLIFVTFGRSTSVSFLQFSNTYFSIVLTFGILLLSIFVNPHPLKAPSPIVSTFGRPISFKLVHPENASLSIDVMFLRLTFFKFVRLLNVFPFIEVTFGKSSLSISSSPDFSNALSPISVTFGK